MRVVPRPARSVVAVALAVTLAAVLAPAGRAEAITGQEKRAILSRELASSSLFRQMYAGRTRAPYNAFDWSSDGCSWAPERPAGFDFSGGCRRHDFNYRNFKAVGLFTSGTKTAIDRAFLADLKAACPTRGAKRTACLGLAAAYHEAVKRLA